VERGSEAGVDGMGQAGKIILDFGFWILDWEALWDSNLESKIEI
jgi:hypothetical protein